ncbi:MAG TPA: LysR family transcriptional regulator [Sphingorhabdus sp.]|nr:LysR family transcriptional regulator [Sphingorhabdus sp.]
MEMQQVRYFVAVAETLNFTRAAEQCNVTQPALTRAIKQLEFELGGDLIRREGRNTHLTDLGNKMLPMLRQCYDSALAAKTLAKAVAKGDISCLSIAVSRSFSLHLIVGALSEMYAAFPGIQLKFKRGTAAEVAALLKSGDADVALGGPLGDNWDRLEAWPMFTESFDLVVGSGHPLAGKNAIDLDVELIKDERFLLHSGTELTDYERQTLGAAGIDISSAHEVDSSRDMETLVGAGFGIGVVPATALKATNVRHLNFGGIEVRRAIAIYSVAGRLRSREAAALLNLLRGADWSGVLG